MLGLGLGLNKATSNNKFALDTILQQYLAASYGVRRLRTSYTGPILRIRDDTGIENNIYSIGEKLDTGTMLSWLQRNQVASIPLGVDANADGVSDGWSSLKDASLTASPSIDESSQKLAITASTASGQYLIYRDFPCVAGNIINFKATYKVGNLVGGTVARIVVRALNSGGGTISDLTDQNNLNSTNFTTVTVSNLVCPSNTANIRVYFIVRATASGDTGSAWFKDASVTISNQSAYVSTWYDQSGNGNHATQSTVANQPRIVNSGIVDRDFDATKANTLYPTFASASGVNIVSNGDFSNGTTGWTFTNGTGTVANNILTTTGNNTSALVEAGNTTTTAVVIGKRYFVRAKIKVNDAVCQNITLRVVGSGGGSSSVLAIQSTPSNGTQYTMYGIYIGDATHTGNIRVLCRALYADAATANGKVMEVQEVVAIDVTELGQPTLKFTRTSTHNLEASDSNNFKATSNLTLNHISSSNDTINSMAVAGYKDNSNYKYLLGYKTTNGTSSVGYVTTTSGNSSTGAGIILASNQAINMFTYDKSLSVSRLKYYYNGTFKNSSNGYNEDILTNGTKFSIGNALNAFEGYITEIIVFSTTLTDTQRSKIEKNQGKYYGITV